MGIDAEPVRYRFQTDRFGFRNAEEKADPRVVCIGDSMIVAGL